MTTAITDAAGDRGRHVEQVFDKYHLRLRRYFLVQIGDIAEADACVRETICRFFDHMEGRQWGQEIDDVNGHLMRIAFVLYSQKYPGQKWQGADASDTHEARSHSFKKNRNESIRSIKQHLRLKQFFLRSGDES